MKPSMAARPFNFSVWVWNPKRGSFRLGITEGSIMSETDRKQQFGAARAAHVNGSERITHRLGGPAPADSQPQPGQGLALLQARYRHLDG